MKVRAMTRKLRQVLPMWLIFTLLGAGILSPIAAYLLLRHPPRPSLPPAIVVSNCGDLAPGVRRAGFTRWAMKFDVPEAGFTLQSQLLDMPIETLHCVCITHSAANGALLISESRIPGERELQSQWPVFSERVEERDVRNTSGRVAGKDRWGYFRSGAQWKCWRLVTFAAGGEAGYLPTPPEVAQLFDQVISSACFSAATGR